LSKIKHIPTDEVHELNNDEKTTGCGFDTTEKPECWEMVEANSEVTCSKNGCK